MDIRFHIAKLSRQNIKDAVTYLILYLSFRTKIGKGPDTGPLLKIAKK